MSYTITAIDSSGKLALTGNISDDTITVTTGTTTVTITQGSEVTLKSPLKLPTSFSNKSIGISAKSLALTNSEFTFTCTNNLADNATAFTTAFTVTSNIGNAPSPQVKDPTIIFNPPE